MFNVNNRKKSDWNDELRIETMGVWNEAVDLSNRISAATKNFPREDRLDLKGQITESAKKLADKIANSSSSRTQSDFEESLRQAVELVHETMGLLYIAKQWNFMSQTYYEQLFNRGRALVGQLCLFGGLSYTTSEVN